MTELVPLEKLDIRAIAAIDSMCGIAKEGKIPWTLPPDLRYFKDVTRRDVVIMGSNTFTNDLQSKPLPERHNFVFSCNRKYYPDGKRYMEDVTFVPNLASLVKRLNEHELTDTTIWVIGGSKIFSLFYDLYRKIYLTEVIGDFGCDSYFDSLPCLLRQFRLSAQRPPQPLTFFHERNSVDNAGFAYRFNIFERIKEPKTSFL